MPGPGWKARPSYLVSSRPMRNSVSTTRWTVPEEQYLSVLFGLCTHMYSLYIHVLTHTHVHTCTPSFHVPSIDGKVYRKICILRKAGYPHLSLRNDSQTTDYTPADDKSKTPTTDEGRQFGHLSKTKHKFSDQYSCCYLSELKTYVHTHMNKCL